MGEYISTKEYADKHGLNINTVRQRIQRGQMPYIKKGNRWYIDEDVEFMSKAQGFYKPPKEMPSEEELSLIPIKQYATEHGIGYKTMVSDVAHGLYKTARKVGDRILVSPDEEPPKKGVTRGGWAKFKSEFELEKQKEKVLATRAETKARKLAENKE